MTTFRITIPEFNEHTLAILQLLKTDTSIMIEEETQTDWYEELTQEQRESINKGIADVKAGRVTPHESVVSEIRQLIAQANEAEEAYKNGDYISQEVLKVKSQKW
jgi:predicted transcriptional regulator